MMATFTGTGTSVTANVEGVEKRADITRNTIHPLYRGEFVFILFSVTPILGREYISEFTIKVNYTMTQETSGKELNITAGDDAVRGQSTLKSGVCSFMVDWTAQNETTHFIEWKQPNCSGFTKISKYIVTMGCGCDATLDVCTWEETLSSVATNASFEGLPTGPWRVCVTAVNYCEEETSVELNFSIEPNSGDVIHKTSRRWMWMILLALAVHQLWLWLA